MGLGEYMGGADDDDDDVWSVVRASHVRQFGVILYGEIDQSNVPV